MWKKGDTISELRFVLDALKVVMEIELPKRDFELVHDTEKDSIEEW
jgi:hypothetical protein